MEVENWKKNLQYLKYGLIYDFFNLGKFIAQKGVSPSKISLNLRVMLSSGPCYLTYTYCIFTIES